MTVQPAIGDPFFEMEDAYRWFKKRYTKIDPADLMSLSALDPPPGYAQVQEERARRHGGKSRHWEIPQWHHFRMYRDGGPPMLAVVLGMQRPPEQILGIDGSMMRAWVDYSLVWRVWLYEHRQGRGWVCLDPGDESHEAVRRLRAEMVLETLR